MRDPAVARSACRSASEMPCVRERTGTSVLGYAGGAEDVLSTALRDKASQQAQAAFVTMLGIE